MKINIYDKYKQAIVDNNLICTSKELEEYLMYGLLVSIKDKYYDRNNNIITVDVQQPKSFNINLSSLISSSISLAKKNYVKRIYCMSTNTYNRYKENGLIIDKDNKEYFCKFNNEEWLINKF